MNTHIITNLFAACLLTTACSAYNPELVTSPALTLGEVSASVDNQTDTKTSINSEYKVLWDESGEAISVVDGDGACYEMVQKSVSTDRKSASFTGEIPASGCLYAIYPVQAEVPVESGLLEISIPTEQEAIAGSFDTATNLALAKIGSDNSLSFKNVCGVIGFSVNASGITSIRLSATETGGGALSGSANVDFSGDTPICITDKEIGAEYIELLGDIQSGSRYYAVVYPGTYDNLELSFTNEDGKTASFKRDGQLTISRNSLLNINAITITEDDWSGGDEPGGTASLSYSESSSYVKGYNSPADYTNDYGTWAICAFNPTSGQKGFQLNGGKVAYIGTPVMPGVISSVKLTLTSDSGTNGNFFICSSPGGTSQPDGSMSVKCAGVETTIDVTSLELKQLWIRSSFFVKISEVSVVWGGGGNDNPDPDPDPDPDPNPDPDPGSSGLADYGWFELPAQTDKNADGRDDNIPDYYYSHTFREDAPKIRNFSCCYSKGNMQPVWVAAPMHNCYKGSSGRNDSYKADPNIKCAQASKVDGYTRGHMLGSSDRTVSKPTNRQVFYYSNIGAQLQSGFNTGGGSWNNLESLTDGQWCADTLYQVIGCIFTKFTDRYGKTVEPKTVGSVHIPTAYYKVLLRTKSGKTGKRVNQCKPEELKCAAFILGHRNNAGHKPSASDMYTVEELEALTGLTFFVNVPNAPKSEAVASDWGL